MLGTNVEWLKREINLVRIIPHGKGTGLDIRHSIIVYIKQGVVLKNAKCVGVPKEIVDTSGQI